jgi:hypothetical protein
LWRTWISSWEAWWWRGEVVTGLNSIDCKWRTSTPGPSVASRNLESTCFCDSILRFGGPMRIQLHQAATRDGCQERSCLKKLLVSPNSLFFPISRKLTRIEVPLRRHAEGYSLLSSDSVDLLPFPASETNALRPSFLPIALNSMEWSCGMVATHLLSLLLLLSLRNHREPPEPPSLTILTAVERPSSTTIQ